VETAASYGHEVWPMKREEKVITCSESGLSEKGKIVEMDKIQNDETRR
jgi:hypothetical protein